MLVMPGIVLRPFAVVGGKKSWRPRLLAYLGLALIIGVLLASAGCGGGGPAANSNPRAVTPAGNYAAFITYNNQGNSVPLASVPVNVP